MKPQLRSKVPGITLGNERLLSEIVCAAIGVAAIQRVPKMTVVIQLLSVAKLSGRSFIGGIEQFSMLRSNRFPGNSRVGSSAGPFDNRTFVRNVDYDDVS